MSNQGDHLFLRMCRGETCERTPVWAMRQAGRWDPEFQKLRTGRSFFEFSENPELAAAASLCPRRFGVDAIILFYDITTLSIGMGQEFDLVPERGPLPRSPIRTAADVRRLSTSPSGRGIDSVLKTLSIVRKELGGSLPVLAFAGAPFTLATYMIGAGKDLAVTRQFVKDQSQAWSQLLDKICFATIEFLRQLNAAGADAYQIFDSWAGGLEFAEYREYCHRFHSRIFGEVGQLGCLFVKDCPYLDLMAASGAKIVSLGSVHNLRETKDNYPGIVVQGNVDHQLLVSGNIKTVEEATRKCLEDGNGIRHILNLDHGMDKHAKPENFEAFVDQARRWAPVPVKRKV